MKFFTSIPDMIKGILLIAAGIILLLNSLGLATQILHTLVAIGAILMIILGAYYCNLNTFFYKLFRKKDLPK